VRRILGVLRADDVTGPDDVIVLTQARTVNELGKLVVAQIQAPAARCSHRSWRCQMR
jgi:hypothetical protein